MESGECGPLTSTWSSTSGDDVKPYYEASGVSIFLGDAREVLPQIQQPATCITDPVWPNSVFPSVTDPAKLFAETAALLTCIRLVVHLGCTSDPRFLLGVPERLGFLRVCWLRYARPSYRGRILIGSDVAYAFGVAPDSRAGRHLLSGESCARNNSNKIAHTGRGAGTSDGVDYDDLPHPSPRRLEHLEWLISVFCEEDVIDPFCGVGTTLLAAKSHGVRAVGIEINEAYAEIAAKRLSQEVFDFGDPR